MPGIMSESDLQVLGGRRDSSSLGQHSLLSAMNNFVSAVDLMDAAVMIPCKLQDMSPDINIKSPSGNHINGESKSLVPTPANGQTIDMYTYYTMLNAIKSELVQGPPKDENEYSESEDISEQTAAAFRHHLRGLFDVLRQMTSTAELLTTTYKAEVGDTSSDFSSPSRSFANYSL